MIISSGSKLLDKILNGGFRSGITTIYGPSSSGKTTTCLLTSINQSNKNKKVLFIDTENGFSVERIKQLSGDNFKNILDNIIVVKPKSFLEQEETIKKLNKTLDNFSLIILDTITFFYRFEFANDLSQFKSINSSLINQLKELKHFSKKHNVPILLTNQVYSDFNSRDDVKMVGGEILKRDSECIIKLQNTDTNIKEFTLIKHNSVKEKKQIKFEIKEKGIFDYSSTK